MSKILKIGVACALTCALTNVTLAATFDPLADAATNSDALLGLDLPTDFGNLDPLTIPATTDPTTPTTTVPVTNTPTTTPTTTTATTTATTTTVPTTTVTPTTVGSGGALDGTSEPQTSAKTVSVSQKKTTNQNLMTPMPSSFSNGEMMNTVSGNTISGGMTSVSTVHNYGMHGSATKSKLAETGPAETLTLAFGAAIGLAILIRRKLKHA